MAWEIIFMLLLLKIPIVYLCVIVWWAIKSEPSPPDLAGVAVVADTPPVGGSPTRRRTGRRRPLHPHAPRRGGAVSLPQRRRARA